MAKNTMRARIKRSFLKLLGHTAMLDHPARASLWAFLQEALSPDEKSRLGVALYDVSREYRDAPEYTWELEWWRGELPAAGARVLLGAAGAGREAALLAALGHEVTALEPSRDLAQMCRRKGVHVVEARYEDLVAATRPPAVASMCTQFDAVVMGLGSLSHILDAEMRVRVVRELVRTAPNGAVLTSSLAAVTPRSDGRAARMGRAFARPIRAARPLPPVDRNEVVFGGLGFAKCFERAELEALAHAVGRTPRFFEGGPPGMWLCTLVP
ncbi:MAG: methyltransferase domain-containing protein [Polyangiaceae bacterium]|nr:methyltransferase domain-containing protein [Polyangiaceae bacterium]